MSRTLLEHLLSGSTILYFFLFALALLALALRRLSSDPYIRRRALVVVGLLALFTLVQSLLGRIPERVSGFVTTPGGEQVPGLVPNSTHQVVSVIALIIGYLSVLLLTTLLVDFLLVRRFKVGIPNILRDVAVSTLFFFGLLLILYYRTNLDITGLFTTSAVISIVIGLALQDTLGNVFSGLALQTERSFNVGDWVRFAELEGVVTDITWRSTKIRTRTNDLVIIPNSVIGKDTLINYSAPTRIHAILEEVGVHYRHAPGDVIAALEEAADQTDAILKRPRVDVRTVSYGDFAIVYNIKYWIRDYADLEDIKNAFMSRVWYVFDRRGIEIPFPIRNVFMKEITPETEEAAAKEDDARIFDHLERVELFDALTREEKMELATRGRVERFYTGETVLHQGSAGDSLYIIEEGRVEVVVDHDGRQEHVADLGAGAFFGEMALMTGAERQATVVAAEPTDFFVIDREAFRETIEANPQIVERISLVLAERNQELEATHAALHDTTTEEIEEERKKILRRIWDFFGSSDRS